MSPDQPQASAPDVSVVIPTHRRETRLAFALEALSAQTIPPERFEVVVVRSPATEPPFAAAPEGLNVRFLASDEANRPAQRNVGWRAARAGLVAFTDDDCRPAPDWLEALLGAAAGSDRALIQGRTEPDPDEAHLLHGLARSIRVVQPSPWYPSCNIAFSRELLERLDGFDEAFVHSGEDTDLALRALREGADFHYDDDALVWHAVVPQPVHAAAGSAWRRWVDTPLVFRRHPDHRRHLFGRFFFNREHAQLALFLAALALVRRRPAVGLPLAVPFLLEGLDPADLSPRRVVRHATHVPSRLVVEAAQAGGIVRGALRHGAPMF